MAHKVGCQLVARGVRHRDKVLYPDGVFNLTADTLAYNGYTEPLASRIDCGRRTGRSSANNYNVIASLNRLEAVGSLICAEFFLQV